MSDSPGGVDWIEASDHKWYPPDQVAATGWILGEDGKWHAPLDDAPPDMSGTHGVTPPSGTTWSPIRAGWQFWVAAGAAVFFLIVAITAVATKTSSVDDLNNEIAQLASERDEANSQIAGAESDAEQQVAVAQADADQTVAEAQDELDERDARLDERKQRIDEREAAIADRESELEDQAAYLDQLVGAAEASQFGDGIHLVGTDIQPGRYRNEAVAINCYWARLSGVGGSFGDIIANNNSSGPTVVDISASDVAFESNGCGTWTKIG